MKYIKNFTLKNKNFIYAPLFKLGEYNGSINDPFFKYLLEILSVGNIKFKFWKFRPKKNKMEPRSHVSMWADINGELYFFDKSDHIQEIDIEALDICGKYFKDNYNEIEIKRVLSQENKMNHFDKIKPFFSVGDIYRFYKFSQNNSFDIDFDLCQIMSLYTSPLNFVKKGYQKNYRSAFDHSFIRYKTFNLLKSSKEIKSHINLSTKDKTWFYPKNSQYLGFNEYSKLIMKTKIGIVNTIPHRIFPWKVSEMISLGTPFAVDEKPITQFPPFIKLNINEHYIDIFPGVSSFNHDLNADPFSINSYSSLLKTYDNELFKNLFIKFLNKIKNPELIKYLTKNIMSFRDNILLNRELFFDYIISA
ncbi:MAG: hypothetical protein CMG75_07770 [Candidatus Marinimicrobia bacterium]|nr:hypothetical protein [Candidatus Neomarinimicrobiota bacterium]|tara:strand:- start:8071 stop:9156 length:1086 start_codon:yes stop_codon:yes gene_type:complete